MTKRDLIWAYRRWLTEGDTTALTDCLAAFLGEPVRCPLCHGRKLVNFEQAAGWDEPCPRCAA